MSQTEDPNGTQEPVSTDPPLNTQDPATGEGAGGREDVRPPTDDVHDDAAKEPSSEDKQTPPQAEGDIVHGDKNIEN